MEPAQDSCDMLFEEARQLLDEQQYAQAVEAFTDFIALVPESEGAYGNRGLAYMNLGDDEQAIQDFEMVLTLNQEDAMAYAMMAEAFKNQGRYEDALEAAVAAMEIDAEEPEAYYVRGWLFARAGQHQLAAEDLERFVSAVEEPGEVGDLLEACRVLSGATPTTGEGASPVEDGERYLAERGLSFDFEYKAEHEAEALICPYAHCIRNMPRRGPEAWHACPLAGHECPGGEKQVAICREYPPDGA